MSRGTNLQEMEVGTKQSRTAVNAGAKAGEAMSHSNASGVSTPGQTGNWEDLGGPTPDNYKVDDDSAKLKEPSGLKSVSAVTKGAKGADPMKGLKKSDAIKEDEDLEDEEVIEEELEEEETVTEAKKEDKEDDDEEDDEEDEDEKEEEVKESFDIEEDLQALQNINEEEGLSEEYQEKSRIVFESALRSKVAQIKEALEEQYESKFEQQITESVEEIKSELQERVDAYLEYVADEWIAQNELAVQAGLKEELTESFLSGMKNLFEEHYVQIPEEKYDVLESMVEKLDEMETKLNEQIERNILLNNRLSESVADRIFDEISEGLAVTQKEKLASLSESVEFESETQYREKLETLKESYFPKKTVSEQAKVETLSEGVDVAVESHSPAMSAYLRTLSTVAKN
jgi:hypothetical protein